MALPKVSLRWSPTPGALNSRFAKAARELSKVVGRDVTVQLADDLAELIRRRVRRESRDSLGRSGGGLPRLAPLTVKLRSRRGYGSSSRRTLTEEGDLLDSLIGGKRGGDLLVFFAGTHPRAKVSNATLALWQNKGTKGYTAAEKPRGIYPNRGIPQTDFFGITEEEELWLKLQVEEILLRVTVPNIMKTLDGR